MINLYILWTRVYILLLIRIEIIIYKAFTSVNNNKTESRWNV